MTAKAIAEAQKEALRVHTNHMLHVAGGARVIDTQRANGHILEKDYRVSRKTAACKARTDQVHSLEDLGQDSKRFELCSSAQGFDFAGTSGD